MKTSLLLALVLLTLGALLGWKRHGDLVTMREVHRRTAEEVRTLGLDPEEIAAESKPPPRLKSDRGSAADKTAEAKAFTRELIDFALEMKELEKSRSTPDAGARMRIMEILGRFMDLNAAQIKTVIADLRDSTELDDEMRRGIVGLSVMMLASDHPQAALAIFAESSDMAGMGDMGNHVVSSTLGKWAMDDPLAALAWMRDHAGKHADIITDEARSLVLAGAARQDPKLALSLLDEVDLKEDARAGALARGIRGAEERDALLSALRADRKHAGLLESTLAVIGNQMVEEGFEANRSWLSSSSLDDSELKIIADSISPWQAKNDTGRWIEWMEDKLPAESLERKVGEMIGQWTRNDYQAAGEWINGASDGPAKQAAVKSYARTLAPYEPATAARWALTLPAGKERDGVVRNIHDAWKEQDEAAAADFARQQGIGK